MAALCAICALSIVLAAASRRLQERGRTRVGRALGALLISYVVVVYTRLLTTGQFGADWALPFELCHWVLIAAVIALFFHSRFASEIAYFWGFGGTLQAVLTPDLSRGFPSWDFAMFFWGHGVTLVAVVFLISAKRFRPRPGSIVRMFLALNVYAVVAGAINAVFGWNYGYLRHKPAEPSLLDYLGPWPWYLVTLEALALVMFCILLLPWMFFDRTDRPDS